MIGEAVRLEEPLATIVQECLFTCLEDQEYSIDQAHLG